MKKYLVSLSAIFLFIFLNIRYYEFEISEKDIDSSLIGLTINGSSTTNFPNKESGYAFDSIRCDKDATGVWDYENWGLKVRGVHQSRTKCQINFVSKYSESILNGTDPVLKEELIPVTIENDGTVRKTSLGWEWYKYEEQKWANAVILNNETEIYYDGDIIPESAIESYFVWIPRYKYKLFDMGEYEGLTTLQNKPQIIDIQFGVDTTNDSDNSCKTPGISGASGTCSVGKYMTHPAFLAFGTNGMWVGKFETGYKGATTKEEAQKNENNASKVQIKPDVYSWRGIQVANAYLNSYNYKREMDSHMMKNTEWGAVAYLQHSKYGSHTRLRVNNNESFVTGYGAVQDLTIGYTGINISCKENPNECNEYGVSSDIVKPWNTDIGILSSTTKNISGIYDMSGGVWEKVMAVMANQSGVPCSGRDENNHSGFQGPYCNSDGSFVGAENFPADSKYYDLYLYADLYTYYSNRILGDATGELGGFRKVEYHSVQQSVQQFVSSWNEGSALFVYKQNPWFNRGGAYLHGKNAGIFSFGYSIGSASGADGFRIVFSFS